MAASLSLASLVRYHVGLVWTARALERPPYAEGRSGEATWTGRAGGDTIRLPSGDSALVAVTEVWDRPPSRKGATVLCRDAAFGALTVDGRPVAFHPEPGRVLDASSRKLLSSLLPVYVDLEAPARTARIPHGRCAVESALSGAVLRVRALRPGDTVTVAGCVVDGTLKPCDDGRDVLSARPPGPALHALRGGELPFLLFAAFVGVPSLAWLVALLARHTAKLAREAPR